MNSANLKKTMNIVGSFLAVFSLFFVFFRLKNYLTPEVYGYFNPLVIVLLLIISIAYGGSSIILGCVWKNILEKCGEKRSYLWAIKVYGTSQIAKYIPGNIFHYAGRQALGMADSASAKKLAKSTLWELVLLVFSGALFSILIIPLLIKINSSYILLLLFFFIAVLFLVNYFFQIFLGCNFAKAFRLQIFFLIISGATFSAVLFMITQGNVLVNNIDTRWLVIIIPAAYVCAWLIGLITPGAPAGVGVREVVLIYLLGGFFNENDLLISVVISRIVTVVGDFIFYGIACAMKKSEFK